MQLQIYQWLVPLIGLLFIIRTIRQYFLRKKGIWNTIVWIVLWIGVSGIAILPNPITVSIAKFLGFKSNVNAIIFAGIGVLLIIIFSLSSSVNKLEAQVTELVREIAKQSPSSKNDEE